MADNKEQQKRELRDAIIEVSQKYNWEPRDLATTISYETRGTFDPWIKGPTTKWGTHRGLIQWGEPQAKKYGVSRETSIRDQVIAAGEYLIDRGVKPGDGLLPMYAAINAGHASNIHASDAHAGGAPGTVLDKVRDQMEGHKAKADKLLAMEGGAPAERFVVPEGDNIGALIAADGLLDTLKSGAGVGSAYSNELPLEMPQGNILNMFQNNKQPKARSIGESMANAVGMSNAYANIPENELSMFEQWNSAPIANEQENLSQIHPDLQAVIELARTKTDVPFVLGSGKRSEDLQKKAVDWGWSGTMNSNHLDSNAADLWPLDENGAVKFDEGLQKEVANAMKEAAQELGVPMQAGADWKNKDMPHFEVTDPANTYVAPTEQTQPVMPDANMQASTATVEPVSRSPLPPVSQPSGSSGDARPSSIISPEMMKDQYSKYRGSYAPSPTPAPSGPSTTASAAYLPNNQSSPSILRQVGPDQARDQMRAAPPSAISNAEMKLFRDASPGLTTSQAAPQIGGYDEVRQAPEIGGYDEVPEAPYQGNANIANLLDLVPPTPTDPPKADALATTLGTGLLTPAVMGQPVAPVVPMSPDVVRNQQFAGNSLTAAAPPPPPPPPPSAMDVWKGRETYGVDNTGGYELQRSPSGNVFRYSRQFDRTDILNPDGSYRGQIKGRIENPAEREKGFDVPEVFKGIGEARDSFKNSQVGGLLGAIGNIARMPSNAVQGLLGNLFGGNTASYMGTGPAGIPLYGNPTGNPNEFPDAPINRNPTDNGGLSVSEQRAQAKSRGFSDNVIDAAFSGRGGLF